MSSNLKLKNNINSEFNIQHVDNAPAVSITSTDLSKINPVDTIATLRAMTYAPTTVWVSGYHTKNDGAFGSNIYRWNPTSTATDNGGTIIKLTSITTGRYELQYSGDVNIKWFGVKLNSASLSSSVNTESFNRCQTYCYENKISVTSDNGYIYINDNINIRSNTNLNGLTIYADSTMKNNATIGTEVLIRDGHSIFEYAKPSQSMVTVKGDIVFTNAKIVGGNFINDNTTLNTNLANLIGLNIEGDTTADIEHYKPSSRNKISDIIVQSCYTGISGIGWLGDIGKIFIKGAKLGMFWYQANCVKFNIVFENVEKAFNLYEINSAQFEGLGIDGNVNLIPSEINAAHGVSINGLYCENFANATSSIIEIGKKVPIDSSASNNMDKYIKCYDININNLHTALISADNVDSYFDIDYAENVVISGQINNRYIPVYSSTINTVNVSDLYCSGLESVPKKNYAPTSKAINISHNCIFKHKLSGFTVYASGASVSILNFGQEVTSPVGGNVIKVVANGASNVVLPLYTKFAKYGELFKEYGCTIGLWLYMPKNQLHTVSDLITMPKYTFQPFNSDSSSLQGVTSFNGLFDEWFYCSAYVPTTSFTNAFNVYIRPNGSTLVAPLNHTFYIGSYDLFIGKVDSKKASAGDFVCNNSIAYEVDGVLVYRDAPDVKNTNTGDLFVNPSAISGARPFLRNPAPNTVITSWTPVGIPNVIPTTNNGVGTIWSNNGVLTLGS